MSGNGKADDELAASFGFLAADAPRYALWRRPGRRLGAAVTETGADGSASWLVHIHDDALCAAVDSALERHGAPVFTEFGRHDAYVEELRRQLRAGLPPARARDAALRALGLPPVTGAASSPT